MASFQTLPGFRDFYPEDFAERRFIFQVWRQTARRFGFQEFDGPALESLELFKAKSGAEIEAQLFAFEDKGGRSVALRPELTPTLARMVGAKANALKRPIKWFSVGDHYRYERMQRGRLRCFTQLNVDILGEPGPAADAELIALLVQILQAFGFSESDFYIRLSDRKLWALFLESIGISEDEMPNVLGVIDKWERLSRDAVSQRLVELLGQRGESVRIRIEAFLAVSELSEAAAVFGDAVLKTALEQRLGEWQQLLSMLAAMGVGNLVKLDFGIVRGLAYYTGFVFEAFDRKGELRALAGGGRYDDLVERMGGPDMPALGFGMGDVVLAELLREREKMPRFVDTLDAYAIIGGEEERAEALADVSRLRMAGFSVDYSFKLRAIGKQLKEAIASGARLALIYGSEERERGVVKVRNLANRSEEDIPREQLAVALSKHHG